MFCCSYCLGDCEDLSINTAVEDAIKPIDAQAKRLFVPDKYKTIQDAVNAANPGEVVHVKTGDYEGMVTLKDGVSLEGDGRDKVTVHCDAREGRVVSIKDCCNVRISGLKFMHQNTGELPKDFVGRFAVVKISNSVVWIDNCTITASGHNGIGIEGQKPCKITNCIISLNTCSGVMMGESKGSIINGNRIYENGNHGIALLNGAEAQIGDNTCQANKYSGILVRESGTKAVLKKNTCNSNRYCGIYFGESCRGKAVGNTCKENEQGIEVSSGGTDATLLENTCSQNAYNGIYFCNAAQGDVHFNNTFENKWHGISGEADCKVNVTDNTSERNVRAGVYNGGWQIRMARNKLVDNGHITTGQVYSMFHEGHIAELEKMAVELRTKKAKYQDGGWQISRFYEGIAVGYDDPSTYGPVVEKIKQWIHEYPESITPRILLAKQYIIIGWHARGGGFAYSVSQKGRDEFKDNLEKARTVLIEAEKLKIKDPELYSTWIYADLGLSETEEMRQMFDKGVALEPQYWPLYYQYSWGLMPRWYGKCGDYERFANEAVTLSGEKNMYASLAYEIIGRADVNEFKTMGFDYERLKAYRVEREKDSDMKFKNKSCFIACAYEKKEEARELFLQIGQNWGEIWEREDIFQAFKNWAFDKGPYPKAEEASSKPSLIKNLINKILD